MTVSAGSATSQLALPGFLAAQPVLQQMKILGGIFIFLMLIIAGLVVHDNRESTENTAYIAASGEMRMLSQRLAKASTLALQGNPLAFTQLKESRATFAKLYEQLANGGEFGGPGFQLRLTASVRSWSFLASAGRALTRMPRR